MTRASYIVSLIVLAHSLSVSQSTLPDPKMHSLIQQGIELTWQEEYRGADSVFQCVAREFPDHPAGYVYQAGVALSKAMDNEMEVDVTKFDSLISIGRKMATGLIESRTDKKWGHFFEGTADGSDSYARVYRGDWFGGTRKGFASVSAFKDAVKIDSTLYDAYAGIGAFYYWRSRKTEFFNWIPFVGDDRSEAVMLLNRTVDKGVYNRYTALSMLVTIQTDAERYDQAISCSRQGLLRFPRNRMFLWGLATACHKAGLWSDAAASYKQLLDVIMQSQDNNHYNEIVCCLNLAKVKAELRDSSSMEALLNRITKFREADLPAHLKIRVQDKLDQAEKMLRELGRVSMPAGKQ